MGSFQQLPISGGRGNQGRNEQSRGTAVQPWGELLIPGQGTYIAISLSCFAGTETPSRWEKGNDDMLLTACRPQTGWNLKVGDAVLLTSPLTGQYVGKVCDFLSSFLLQQRFQTTGLGLVVAQNLIW